ncbi:hypothetical protein KKF91_12025 [Myxococcota bacterium]|nr:hypothetical protein [Myxococcota bacterium]
MKASHYAPSGGFSIAALLTIPIIVLPTAALLAALYAYLSVYNPFIYVTALGTMAFGAGVGLSMNLAARWGKIRAPKLVGLALLLAAAASLYLTWVVWVHAFLGRGDLDVWIWGPAELWGVIQLVAQQGAWSLSSYTPTGIVLYIFWGAEALLLIGFIFIVGLNQVYAPFCERCAAWMTELDSQAWAGTSDEPALIARIKAGALEAVEDSDGEGAPLALTLHHCPRCQRVGTLSLKAVTVTVNDKGKEETSTRDLIEHLMLDEDGLRRARALRASEVE